MKTVIHMAAECMLFEALGPDEFEAALAKFAEIVRAAEREACAYRAGIALLGTDRGLANRVDQAIRARSNT